MVAYEPECRVTVGIPHPDLFRGFEKIGVAVGQKRWFVTLPDGDVTFCNTLPQAVNRWLNLGRHNARLGCQVASDGKFARCAFDGTAWGEWK